MGKQAWFMVHVAITLMLLAWNVVATYTSSEWHYQYRTMAVFYSELIEQQRVLMLECSRVVLVETENKFIKQKLGGIEKGGIKLRYPINEKSVEVEPGTQPAPKKSGARSFTKQWWGIE